MTPQNCPVCGKKTKTKTAMQKHFWVTCSSIACFTSGPYRPTEEAAIAAWNRLRYAEEGEAE